MKKNILIVLLCVVAVALIALVFIYVNPMQKPTEQAYNPSMYQAVFLDNGQVYFGKVAQADGEYVTITKVYYLQIKQPLQNQINSADLNQSDIALIKLGKELHGPTDKMEINRDHILFIEDLQDYSKVVGAIQKYEQANK